MHSKDLTSGFNVLFPTLAGPLSLCRRYSSRPRLSPQRLPLSAQLFDPTPLLKLTEAWTTRLFRETGSPSACNTLHAYSCLKCSCRSPTCSLKLPPTTVHENMACNLNRHNYKPSQTQDAAGGHCHSLALFQESSEKTLAAAANPETCWHGCSLCS